MEDEKTIEINQETQPIAYAQQTRADRLREASSAPDFTMPAIRPVDDFFSESVMEMDDYMLKDIMRQTGITESTSEQVSTAISNALIGMNQLKDETKIAYGNLANYFTGGKIGDEIAQVAYESITQRYNEMANAEEAIGGIRSELAKLAGGAASFTQLALEGMATFGVLPLAHIGIQEFGQGTYNDMKAYADKHEGSLKGYEPEGFDLAANFANSLLQVGIESWLGVGSPRFLVGASRGFWTEGLSGALQEGVQGALSDLTEAVKGNQDISILLDNAEDYLRDAIVGGILQGSLGAVTYHQNYARAVDATAQAIAKAHGQETPTAKEKEQAKAIIDAKERQESSILTQEFKAAFDASTGEGQLQAKIASALKKAAETKELDLDTANETEMAQRIEQIATQETLNAMDYAREQNRAISDIELNNIVYKDGAIWLEGLTPEVGDKAVGYARVLAERQSGLAELRTRIDANTREIQQLKADLAEAKAQKQESRAQVLQARIDKQNALAEKNRVRAEKLEAQTAKLEKQIAKQMAETPKAEEVVVEPVKAPVAESVVAESVVEKPAVKEPVKMADVKTKKEKPVTERKALKQERIIKNKEQEVKRAEPDSGLVMLNTEQAQQLLKDYQDLLAYKDVDVKKIKDKNEKARAESAKSRLRDIEYNIEYIKYYAGEESTYVPKDVNEILTKWGSESATREETGEKTELTKSKKRVRESAEVYTPKWVVNEMLDLIPAETWENIDATFLEPAGGNGNFVEEILRRKLAKANTTEEKIRALKSVYTIELMLDNVDEMRTRVKLIMEENGVTEGIDYIIKRNIQQGNFLSKENIFGEDISFYDWVNEGTDTLKDMIARGEAEQQQKKQEPIKNVDDEGLLHQAKPTKEIPEKIQKSFDLADENTRLDDIYPEYTGETIEVDGKERTVYNSNGDRIAKSKEALTNFWRWFGDSKVVDEQGRPLVVYHGSENLFDIFEKTDVANAYFFAGDKKVAERFRTTEQRKAESKYYAENTVVEPVSEEKYDSQGRYLGSVHYTKTTLPNYKNFGLYSVYLKADDIQVMSGEQVGAGEFRDSMIESARQSGKDGVIIYQADTGKGETTEYIVFNSNQIKSVDNRGTFSADTGNILKQGSISGKGDTNRGGYDEQLKRIILGEKSDLSTIQHEFAHYWIQNNFKWARSGLASQDWLRRWRDVEEWLGIEPQDRLLSKSASEKFAKAYERYILEGKVAPELQWAFEGFQKAYQDIYDDLENEYFDLDEELAPEVIDWFNRNKEQSPKRLLEADTKKIEKQIALSAGASVIEDVAGTVVMTEPEANGDQKVYMGVKESEIPAGDNLLVQADKTTASKLQQSAKKWLSDKVEVQQLTTLDTQATLDNFKNWIARDRAGAWDAMMNPDTRPIYRTYLYKAFAEEALNDADLAVELANIDMAESVRELGQAIQALDIRNESGFDTIEIIRNIEKSKGKISKEELNKEVESIGLDMIELSQDEIDEVDFDTECKL